MLDSIKKKKEKLLNYIFETRFGNKYLRQFTKEVSPYIGKSDHLTKSEIKEIQNYFKKNLGIKKVNPIYHEYFKRNGIKSIKYIPTYIYRSKIIYRLNDFRMKDAYIDKNIFEKLFQNRVSQPISIIRCTNGIFYTGNYEPISKCQAINLCKNLNQVIIKPTIESSHGDNVRLVSINDGHVEGPINKSVEELFESYGNHFVIQEKLSQHPDLTKLNPSSINTIRLLTYRRNKDNEIVVLYTVIRIGRENQVIDNESAGGMSARIEKNGKIAKYAYSSADCPPFESTDNGIKLEGYKIPEFDKLVKKCKELHKQLPYFNLVGWDMSVSKSGEPVLIEWNVSPDLSQSANGPAFGEYTEEILTYVKNNDTTRFIKLNGKSFT